MVSLGIVPHSSSPGNNIVLFAGLAGYKTYINIARAKGSRWVLSLCKAGDACSTGQGCVGSKNGKGASSCVFLEL